MSGLKLTCTVHGPRPLPRSAPFSPTIILTTHVKYAPFAARHRRGYIRDATERDLAVHLESALRGVIIGDRWPKSGVEVVVTILEGEEDCWWANQLGPMRNHAAAGAGLWGIMGVLSGCITVASAAIADTGIDCVDMVSGGIAALVRTGEDKIENEKRTRPTCTIVLDPVPSEHSEILAACVVGYLPSRDEVTDLWLRGSLEKFREGALLPDKFSHEQLIDGAVQAALGTHHVLTAAVREAAEIKFG
jgi:exosome complex component MTR3